MKKAIKLSALALAMAASVSSFAATQGAAGATSTGSYTNQIGTAAAPQVRVFGLADATMNNASSNIFNGYGSEGGVVDSFCVAHSTGAGVLLTFSSNGITNSNGADLTAVSAATGATLYYSSFVVLASAAPTGYATSLSAAQATREVPSAQTDLVNCTAPNVTKGIWIPGIDPTLTDIYTDVVSVTAAPI